MGKNEQYRAVEESVTQWAKQTQARKDIDQSTKDKIVLEQANQLDSLRRTHGIKE